MTSLGETGQRQLTGILSVPRPQGEAMRILRLWTAFFPAPPGHWAGWIVEGWNVFDFLGMYQQLGWVPASVAPA